MQQYLRQWSRPGLCLPSRVRFGQMALNQGRHPYVALPLHLQRPLSERRGYLTEARLLLNDLEWTAKKGADEDKSITDNYVVDDHHETLKLCSRRTP